MMASEREAEPITRAIQFIVFIYDVCQVLLNWSTMCECTIFIYFERHRKCALWEPINRLSNRQSNFRLCLCPSFLEIWHILFARVSDFVDITNFWHWRSTKNSNKLDGIDCVRVRCDCKFHWEYKITFCIQINGLSQ